ncbi:CarB family protein [Haloechinothrix halophila]|uniref:hypothetical protein n=1 Tax=Haloechinothrix halophila TaxID=1069073 RepID=UPI0006852AC0|nr:hypothetical protein [Haloechinothrix halophila]
MKAGPFTRAQALAAGHSPTRIRRLLTDATWVAVRHGVYVPASTLAAVANDPQRKHALEVSALLLALGRGAVGAGPSAAQILGLDTLDEPAELAVLVNGRAMRGERRDGYVIRRATLPDEHRTTRHGVPITTAARTIVDLAREWPLVNAVVATDSTLRTARTSLPELHTVLADCAGWPGIQHAARVVDLADPDCESALEAISRVAIHTEGLPAPRTQAVISDANGPFARVDFLWEHARVIGEADGLAKYESDGRRNVRDIVRAEKRREERLVDAGYEVVRWGWEDARNPQRLAHRLRGAFTRGCHRQRGRAA